MTTNGGDAYPLGRTEHETARLIRQAHIYGPITRRLFAAAGIGPAMRVLDVGSGAGDMALLLAELVGPMGHVVGVDENPEILRTARGRAEAAGWANVSFLSSGIGELDLDQDFDAVVGRWVLMYVPSPATVLRGLVRFLRPGGIVAFLEGVYSIGARSFPPGPVHEQLSGLMRPPPGANSPHINMGTDLYAAYLDAGLPAPQLTMEAPIGGGPDWPGYRYVADTARSLLPMLARLGVELPDGLDPDGLEDRLRDEVVARRGVQQLPLVVGAWTRT